MDNQEKQGGIEREEQALRLFELLQNVPEDLLERSDMRKPNLIMFVQRYKTTLVACLVLLLVGAGFLGYRSAVGGSNGTSNEAAMDAGFSGSMESAMVDGAVPEEAASEEAETDYEYVADNDAVAEWFQEAIGGAGQGEVTTNKEMADGQESEADAVTEQLKGELETGDPLAAKLSAITMPEGYRYENITSSTKNGGEVLVIRLKGEQDNYVEAVISSAGVVTIPEAYKEAEMTVVDLGGHEVTLSVEDGTLPADDKGVAYLNIYYANGLSVHYNGTLDAKTLYQFLQSIK